MNGIQFRIRTVLIAVSNKTRYTFARARKIAIFSDASLAPCPMAILCIFNDPNSRFEMKTSNCTIFPINFSRFSPFISLRVFMTRIFLRLRGLHLPTRYKSGPKSNASRIDSFDFRFPIRNMCVYVDISVERWKWSTYMYIYRIAYGHRRNAETCLPNLLEIFLNGITITYYKYWRREINNRIFNEFRYFRSLWENWTGNWRGRNCDDLS